MDGNIFDNLMASLLSDDPDPQDALESITDEDNTDPVADPAVDDAGDIESETETEPEAETEVDDDDDEDDDLGMAEDGDDEAEASFESFIAEFDIGVLEDELEDISAELDEDETDEAATESRADKRRALDDNANSERVTTIQKIDRCIKEIEAKRDSINSMITRTKYAKRLGDVNSVANGAVKKLQTLKEKLGGDSEEAMIVMRQGRINSVDKKVDEVYNSAMKKLDKAEAKVSKKLGGGNDAKTEKAVASAAYDIEGWEDDEELDDVDLEALEAVLDADADEIESDFDSFLVGLDTAIESALEGVFDDIDLNELDDEYFDEAIEALVNDAIADGEIALEGIFSNSPEVDAAVKAGDARWKAEKAAKRKSIVDAIKNKAKSIASSIKGGVDKAAATAKSGANKAASAARDTANKAEEKIKESAKSLKETASKAGAAAKGKSAEIKAAVTKIANDRAEHKEKMDEIVQAKEVKQLCTHINGYIKDLAKSSTKAINGIDKMIKEGKSLNSNGEAFNPKASVKIVKNAARSATKAINELKKMLAKAEKMTSSPSVRKDVSKIEARVEAIYNKASQMLTDAEDKANAALGIVIAKHKRDAMKAKTLKKIEADRIASGDARAAKDRLVKAAKNRKAAESYAGLSDEEFDPIFEKFLVAMDKAIEAAINGDLEGAPVEGEIDEDVIDNAMESAILCDILHETCSDQEYNQFLTENATELELYGLIDREALAEESNSTYAAINEDAEAATEAKNIVRLNRDANISRETARIAIGLAKKNKDPLYKFYHKYAVLKRQFRDKIYTKYGAKAAPLARKAIMNVGNRASVMNSKSGTTITNKIDQRLKQLDGNARNGSAIPKKK